jgi:hypothetical protein
LLSFSAISEGLQPHNKPLNGQMHIPCVTVPNPFGGTSVYDITMLKQSNGFVFNLDMSSIKPR